MKISEFFRILEPLTSNEPFFTGVPDSLLKPLCDALFATFGTEGKRHVVAANEGNAAAIAAGYHLATGKVPVVYMQNSGEGNIVNPAASLLHEQVYAVPSLFLVGWRGEPGVHDEPQHIYQGVITERLLELLEIEHTVLSKTTSIEELSAFIARACALAKEGKCAAIVIKKGALEGEFTPTYASENAMVREEIVRLIAEASGGDPIVSTTGKASRELFEIREKRGEGHGMDFLTVGSMGHASSIALGIALEKPNVRVWCVDGDGAVLMHMGAMAVVGARKPNNFVHVVVNNGAHETVGGMPTAIGKVDLAKIAEGCGYPLVLRAETYEELNEALRIAQNSNQLTFLEARANLFSRKDLGRPTTTARQNKADFMEYLKNLG
ncbi:MAG: phosphonopyruvate decarboxylase [Clostridia bacterium]|nr:phosphonopyruvate decarboxylase [Clostridia bacterium]